MKVRVIFKDVKKKKAFLHRMIDANIDFKVKGMHVKFKNVCKENYNYIKTCLGMIDA